MGPTRTMRQEAPELHLLLQKGGVRSPVLLVGHSIGGLIARVYAKEYPEEVAGIALVDATSEDTQLNYRGNIVRIRETAQPRAVPLPTIGFAPTPPMARAKEQKEFAEMQRMLGQPGNSAALQSVAGCHTRASTLAESDTTKRPAIQEDFWPEELQQIHDDRVRNPQPLRDLPLLILGAGRADPAPQDLKPDQLAQFEQMKKEKRRQREESVQLSSNSLLFFDPRSGHHIQLEDPEWLTRLLLVERCGTAPLRRLNHQKSRTPPQDCSGWLSSCPASGAGVCSGVRWARTFRRRWLRLHSFAVRQRKCGHLEGSIWRLPAAADQRSTSPLLIA